ncbi:AAA domain-containing protein [Crenobacter sp. HX-7-9]|uniref:AAA domain-containing protein n=1 Tax=Crenobacter caeni TaxID=2705474 RepID=A0A6B2KUM7_9NEIS|nr:AAA domain-containing protein [Crenobacter caeni]
MQPNTINSYCSGLNHLSKHCGQDLFTLTQLDELDALLVRYAQGGVDQAQGNYGSWAASNALRHWRDYVALIQGGGSVLAQGPTLESFFSDPAEAGLPLPLNQILYGPPGTGKTYETIRASLKILDPAVVGDYDAALATAVSLEEKSQARETLKDRFDQLCAEDRIRFVTFHQSFSYEDFVEGLRAETDETSGQIRYQVVDGVFKSLCELADVKVTRQTDAPLDVAGRTVWKMSLGNTQGSDAGVFDECIENGYVLLGYGGGLDFTGCTDRQAIRQRFEAAGIPLTGNTDYNLTSVTAFATRMKTGDLVVVSDGNFKLRAIGEITGDYSHKSNPGQDSDYVQMRPVKWLRQYSPSLPYTALLNGQFSQMTLYELRSPSLDAFKLEKLLQPQAMDAAATSQDARVLVIDEINRGNISRIFGELITLIEPSKRAGAAEALEVTLPYSKQAFKVPDNVYLIGTMNTADRSLAGLDLALRRRFTFIEMPPKPELLDGVEVEGVNIGQMLRVMNQRITLLLNADHCLGHAYFMPLQDDPTLSRLSAIFRQSILPLLQEYFFEDWERIRWVLNDQSKTDDVAFIVEDKALGLAGLFPGVQDKLRQTPQWQLNESAFDKRAAYAGIAGGQSEAQQDTAVAAASPEMATAG